MTYQESLDYLYGLQKFGIKLGLENIRAFLSRLGHPEKTFKSILVAGTNGKGSISTALAGMLSRSGYRTGLYTSPHLHSFSERIRVDGTAITEKKVAGLVAEMQPIGKSIPLTFFEFTTALALKYCAEQSVDVAILEVGLGGRLDATNAVEPVLGIISPIARDHEQHLGRELVQIAAEKAGIMRSGVPVVSAHQERDVAKCLEAEAAAVGARLVSCAADFSYDDHGELFDYKGMHRSISGLRPAMAGRHQFGNMTTALAAAEMLQEVGFSLESDVMRAGVEQTEWPGRLEWMDNRSVLLDGAHNGAAADVLGRYLAEQGITNAHWIVGAKADKNIDEILVPVVSQVSKLYCVEPPVEEAIPVVDLQSAAEKLACPAETFTSPAEALRKARADAGKDGIILVAGSLFLVASIRELILEDGRECDEDDC